MSTPANVEKEAGNKFWKEGNFDQAIIHYGLAIEANTLAGSDKKFSKEVHSNRSACFLKLHRAELALKDANVCVQLDSQWPKGDGCVVVILSFYCFIIFVNMLRFEGFIRRGDAYYHLRQFTDSYNGNNNSPVLIFVMMLFIFTVISLQCCGEDLSPRPGLPRQIEPRIQSNSRAG